MALYPISYNYKEILVDEIALDGLEGIGLKTLWNRVSYRISSPITDKMKSRFWSTITSLECVQCYISPVPVVEVKVIDRFSLVDEKTGLIKEHDDYLDGPYEFHPIDQDSIHGSCQHYCTRTLIPQDELKKHTYEEMLTIYGDNLIMVASQEERWHALAPHLPISYLDFLTPIHYCMLELVGKARYNGQMTVGITNLTNLVKDPKLLFYNRNHLKELNFLTVVHTTQIMDGKTKSAILIRLKRFHKPRTLTGPTHGRIHDITEYLRNKPNFTEDLHVLMKKSFVKKIKKKKFQIAFNVVKKEPPTSDTEPPRKKTKCITETVTLRTESDESSASDTENEKVELKCEYKVGVNLMRQAYELFMDAGLKGLTQLELGQLLGVEFYTSRAICKTLRTQKVVRQFLEDKGRQRLYRYIAIASKGTLEKKYTNEKKKFLDYLNATSDLTNDSYCNPNVNSEMAEETKLQSDDKELIDNENITEVELISQTAERKSRKGPLFNPNKGPSLKQLQFANGLLKVLHDKVTVIGYHTLGKMVGQEIGQTPMHLKSTKRFVESLAAHGQLRLYNLNWPGYVGRHSTAICAPHVTKSHPTITAAYKELQVVTSLHQDEDKHATAPKSDTVLEDDCIVAFKSYPRYKRAQELHKFIFNLVYENPNLEVRDMCHPYGCVSLVRMMPEMPAALALGHLSPQYITNIRIAKKHESLLTLKLKEVPGYIRKAIVNCKSLLTNIRNNFKILASFGLIQICEPNINTVRIEGTKGSTKDVVFVNRHATIINTTGSWPRVGVDPKSLHIKFHLQNSSDVKRYWNTIYDISTNTTITVTRKRSNLPTVPTRSLDKLIEHDNGSVFGDGFGPAGFDSIYCMEKPKFWHDFNIFQYKKVLKPRKKIPENKVFKTIVRKNTKKNSNKPTARLKLVKKPQVVKTQKNQKTQSKSRSTVKWSKWEDNIIIMVIVARMIMSPNTQPGSLQVSNYVAKELIGLKNSGKTGTYCHKRSIILEKSSLVHRERIINELKRRHLISEYEGLLKKIRTKYTADLSKYLNEARLKMMELVWIIARVIKSESFKHKVPCVANDINDFHKKFSTTPLIEKKNINVYITDSDDSVRLATVAEAILQVVSTINNEELDMHVSHLIYSIFNKYPEDVLRVALEQVKKSGAVSAREKNLHNHLSKIDTDIIQYAFSLRLSAAYERRWGNRLNTVFVTNLADSTEKYMPTDNIEGSPEICCLLFEQCTRDIIDIRTHLSPYVISSDEDQLAGVESESKYKFKCGNISWSLKNNAVENIKNNYQEVDITKALSMLISTASASSPLEPNLNENNVIQYLETKGNIGATYDELKNQLNTNLDASLNDLLNMNIIKQVGYYDKRFVLVKYINSWCITVNEKQIIPAPWIKLDYGIKTTAFLNWSATIVNKVFEAPGMSICNLAHVCEYLSPKHVYDICTVLNEYLCVTLKSLKSSEITLFSNDDISLELNELNPFDSFENTYVFPTKDSLTRYAVLKKKMLELDGQKNAIVEHQKELQKKKL